MRLSAHTHRGAAPVPSPAPTLAADGGGLRSDGARSADGRQEIFAEARKNRPSLSRGAVYRTMDALREAGEALELAFRDGALAANRYDGLRPYSPPPHLRRAWRDPRHPAGGAGELAA